MPREEKIQQESIERYLRSKMSEEEKVVFQFELLQDATLREKLDATRLLQKSVQAATIQQQAAKKKRTTFIAGATFLCIALLVLAFYFYPKTEQSTPNLESLPIPESVSPIAIDSIPQQPPAKAKSATNPVPQEPIKEKVNPKPPKKTTPPPIVKPTPKSQPIASNFQPNPALENLIGSQVRGNDFTFTSNLPSALNTTDALSLSVNLTTAEDPSDYLFRWLLFSNQAADYQNFNPLKEVPLTFSAANGNYTFEQNIPLDLSAGLYYYLIEDMDSGDIFDVGKLEVK
ncbi:MAG: hypothetical protein AB8G22_04890 [Saprospiraceae bacterium]